MRGHLSSARLCSARLASAHLASPRLCSSRLNRTPSAMAGFLVGGVWHNGGTAHLDSSRLSSSPLDSARLLSTHLDSSPLFSTQPNPVSDGGVSHCATATPPQAVAGFPLSPDPAPRPRPRPTSALQHRHTTAPPAGSSPVGTDKPRGTIPPAPSDRTAVPIVRPGPFPYSSLVHPQHPHPRGINLSLAPYPVQRHTGPRILAPPLTHRAKRDRHIAKLPAVRHLYPASVVAEPGVKSSQ
jgi:hypothetical protein